jgi:putative DNA methylase
MSTPERKKLIEVAIPLDDINVEAAREKSIRHGHPSTLHLWWARRPLAACRAVLFAQLVDDPESPGAPKAYLKLIDQLDETKYPPNKTPASRRDKLFAFIKELVKWENSNNPQILNLAHSLINASCDGNPPPVYDPFSGGGSIPLEAQRLGLEAYGSDLNPVAVLIGKALIEIPPKFAGQAPVNPEAQNQKKVTSSWTGAKGLAEDVRYYGQWMRDKAWERIGHLYPKVKDEDGNELTVIAWIWTRTVASPNPILNNSHVPLVRSFTLSSKKGKEAYVEPIITSDNKFYHFEVRQGKLPKHLEDGTVNRQGGTCLLTGTAMPFAYIREEGKAGRMGSRLMAIVAEGRKGRVYLNPTPEMESIAKSANPTWKPSGETPAKLTGGTCYNYGLDEWAKLFTDRQLTALATFSELVTEAREQVKQDALAAGLPNDGTPFAEGGTGAQAYADALSIYLSMAIDRSANTLCTIARWTADRQQTVTAFSRQAIPMTWDYPEVNPFAKAAGDYQVSVEAIEKTLKSLSPSKFSGMCSQKDAASDWINERKLVVSTDPPYYDNIGYADLSDFFYVWLKKSLQEVYPQLFSTLLVPKASELVATPYRHGGKENAEKFFMDGMTQAMQNMTTNAADGYPVTIYYAFKQAETKDGDVSSTGWATFLEAMISAGFAITGTWPMRTELANRMIGSGTNALASSIVMVCRNRPVNAGTITKPEFMRELRKELPKAIEDLQKSNLAPVDFDQAIIGPGMAVYSKYDQVLESSGERMPVRSALAAINQLVYEIRNEEDHDLDRETRFALAWFESYGMEERPFGDAEGFARSKNVSVKGMQEAGFFFASGNKARLLTRKELDEKFTNYDPRQDNRATLWEAVQYLIINHQKDGIESAAQLYQRLGDKAEVAKQLAYRLDSICDKKKWTTERLVYNELVMDWGEIQKAASNMPTRAKEPDVAQMALEV